MVAGGGFEPPTFGLCDLTHLSMRVGLYLHPRGMLAIPSLRLPPPFRGLGSMVSSPQITSSAPICFSHLFDSCLRGLFSPRNLMKMKGVGNITPPTSFFLSGRNTRSGEGAGSRARVLYAFIGARAETLDAAPALCTLRAEKGVRIPQWAETTWIGQNESGPERQGRCFTGEVETV